MFSCLLKQMMTGVVTTGAVSPVQNSSQNIATHKPTPIF